jgi:SAM-dependent methyltransferase
MRAEIASLRDSVRDAYSLAALRPGERHPFPVGRDFAGSIGYPEELLRQMPLPAVEAFTGVSNVSIFAEIPAGATVADLGCGAGLDTLIAARRAGPQGRVLGIDFSLAMLERAAESSRALGAANVAFVRADAERLPVDSASVGVVLVNGIFNLNPRRDAIFQELARIAKPGGSVFGAELILRAPLAEDQRAGSANWFS